MQGPPFCVSEAEIHSSYAGYKIEKLWAKDTLSNNPNLQERGLKEMQEKVYCLEP
jgi:hypothetical protein